MKKSVKAILILIVVSVCIYAAVRLISRPGQKEPSETTVAEGFSGTGDLTAAEDLPAAEEHGGSGEKGGQVETKKGGSGTAEGVKAASGFEFSELFSYSGDYIEDGSDEAVEKVAAVRIRNVSGSDCRYAQVTVVTKDGSYDFTFSTLKNGEAVTVLEQNRKQLAAERKIVGVTVVNNAGFDPAPELYEDVFELTVMDRVLNIRNVSGKDIDGTVCVYYKNQRDGELFGGITYRVSVDSLKAGELKQTSSKHLSEKTSVVEFITYVP